MKHGSSTVRRRAPLPYPRTAEHGRSRQLGVAAAAAALAVLLAAGLSGCGIRDTALPVDAGDAAARTGCPPAPNATLSQLENDENILPATPRVEATRPAGPLLRPRVQASSAASAATGAWPRAYPGAGPTAGVLASPTPNPSATESDGTLSCLHVTGSATAVPSVTPTRSP